MAEINFGRELPPPKNAHELTVDETDVLYVEFKELGNELAISLTELMRNAGALDQTVTSFTIANEMNTAPRKVTVELLKETLQAIAEVGGTVVRLAEHQIAIWPQVLPKAVTDETDR